MNWEAIGAVAELLGALGVIATLAYLAVQIRQNTASNRNVALQTINAQDADSLALVSGNPALADIFFRGNLSFGSLTLQDRVRFAFLMVQVCRIYETRLQLYIDGAIPNAIWEASLRTLEFTASFSGFREWWSIQKGLFSDDFQKLVAVTISDPDPGKDAA